AGGVSRRLPSAPPGVAGSASSANTGSCESGTWLISESLKISIHARQRRAEATYREPADSWRGSRRSLLRLFEIPQVGRRLVLACRHQETVRAQHVTVLADADMRIVLGADLLAPVVPGVGRP